MLEPEMLALLKELPRRTQALWVGSRRPTAAQLEGHGPLDLMIWLDSKTKQIRTGMVVPRNQGPEAMMVALLQAMMEPADDIKPGRPGRIAVEDEGSRSHLAGELGDLGIEMVSWPGSTVLDDAFANMENTLARGPGITYLDKPGNTTERLARFFAAAVRLFEAAPWEGRDDTALLRIEGLDPSPLYVSLLGDAGVEVGLAMYLTVGAARAAVAEESVGADQPVLLLSFSHPDDMGPGVLAEASEHEWPLVDAECLPLLVRTDRGDDFVAHGRELELAMDVIEVVLKHLGKGKPQATQTHILADGRRLEVAWPVEVKP